jgi:hypothetical protein
VKSNCEPNQSQRDLFFVIFGGAMLGAWLRGVLPQNHLDADTKDLVKLGVGLIGTMAASLLGLLVASAWSSYDARSGEVTQMAGNVILLDRGLAHYGPVTGEVRGLLKIMLRGRSMRFDRRRAANKVHVVERLGARACERGQQPGSKIKSSAA